jgi:prophage endopeptidase
MSLTDLIPAQYRLIAAAIAVIAVIAVSAAGGALVNGWRWETKLEAQGRVHADTLREIAQASEAVQRAEQEKRLVVEQQLAGLDQSKTKELNDAQAENDRLRGEYSAADGERQRLRIEVRVAQADAVVSNTAASGGVGDAVSVELSPAAGSTVWNIRQAMIDDRAKIEYLQGYVCTVSPGSPGCSGWD